MTYTRANCMAEVLSAVPGFGERWQAHLDDWDGQPAGLILDMIELAAYAQERLESHAEPELEAIFALMETMLSEGSEEVQNAVATGFLESIVNPVASDTPYLPLLARLLGEKSKAYCKAWLAFGGDTLPGISD